MSISSEAGGGVGETRGPHEAPRDRQERPRSRPRAAKECHALQDPPIRRQEHPRSRLRAAKSPRARTRPRVL